MLVGSFHHHQRCLNYSIGQLSLRLILAKYHHSISDLMTELKGFTARNEVGARLCFYTCLWFCLHGGWYPSMRCRWYPNMPCSRSPGRGWYPSMPCRSLGPHPRGRWGVWPGGSPSPHLGGLQAHTQGISRSTPGGSPGPQWGGAPGTHRGVSRYTLGGVSQHALRQITPPRHTHTHTPDGYCCGC